MTTWPSIREAPPEMWVHFSYARDILRKNEAHSGIVHTGTVEDPERVSLHDNYDVATFCFPAVVYSFERERELVHEYRADSYRAYTSKGTIAYLTATHAGTQQLAHVIGLPTPPRPEQN